MGEAPDYVRLASEVLGIRNAPPALARRLVSQALVIEDRRDVWVQAGERIWPAAPRRRRLHPAGRRGPGAVRRQGDEPAATAADALRAAALAGLKAPLARAAQADWHEVGSELEALLREAVLIRDLRPLVNVQVGEPASAAARAIPPALVDGCDRVAAVGRIRLQPSSWRRARMVAGCSCACASTARTCRGRRRESRRLFGSSTRRCTHASRRRWRRLSFPGSRGAVPMRRASIHTMSSQLAALRRGWAVAARRRLVYRTAGSAIGSRFRYAPLAQLDRASGYEPGGRRFDSCRARHFDVRRNGHALQCPVHAAPRLRLRASGFDSSARRARETAFRPHLASSCPQPSLRSALRFITLL